MAADKHKIWLISSIVIVILIIGFIFIYPNVKKGLAGRAIGTPVSLTINPGEIGIDPVSGTVETDDTFQVVIKANLGTKSANSVETTLAYDKNKLEVTGVTSFLKTSSGWPEGSLLTINKDTAGIISYKNVMDASNTAKKITGKVNLFRVNFKVKTDAKTGASTISLKNTQILDVKTNLITGSKASVLTITGVATPPSGDSSVISLFSCSSPTEGWQSGKTYKLSEDVTTTENKCFSISGVKEIVFDCDGHKIIGGSTDPKSNALAAGIYFNKVNSSTIKNCLISSFPKGIYLSVTKQNVLSNNVLGGNKQGIYLLTSPETTFNQNIACNNEFKNMYCLYSPTLSGSGNLFNIDKVTCTTLGATTYSSCSLEICTDTLDNDGDFSLDCADSDCVSDSSCTEVSVCTPSCSGKACGDDGCGGSCGTCAVGTACSGGSCFTSCTSTSDGPITCEGTKGMRRACAYGACGGTTEIWSAPECAEKVECSVDTDCAAGKKCQDNKCVQFDNLDSDADGVIDSLESIPCISKGTANAIYTFGNLIGCPLGDIDGNGDFDDKDAIMLGEAYVDSLLTGSTLWEGFDLNCDGTVDEKDAIFIGESYVNKLLGTGGDIVKCPG